MHIEFVENKFLHDYVDKPVFEGNNIPHFVEAMSSRDVTFWIKAINDKR